MKALLDTNVVLDALVDRGPFSTAAQALVLAAGDERFEGYITANTTTDVYYILRKHIGKVQARESLIRLFSLFTVIAIDEQDCRQALAVDVDDYEDALLVRCAQKAQLDAIVTRDEELLSSNLDIKFTRPADFIAAL
ncbi:MAG: PIN domain-containing protein [Coriobacteriia bacterium]|nr:PIN domain-containing protein [Coriobacteriia bacterium]